MRKTFVYFISVMVLLIPASAKAQDTVVFPLKIRAGIDLMGPGIYTANHDNFNFEGFVSFDRNERTSWIIEAGYSDYKFSQYNYEYLSRGIFFKAGTDFNLLKPDISKGNYWAGLGLRYGYSIFNTETPSFQHENYWGPVTSSISQKTRSGHFVEIAPGVKTELFKNFSIGWTVRLRFLIFGGGGKDLRPIYFPGFGPGGKNVNTGISYFIVWNIPFKKIKVLIQPEEEEETEELEETEESVPQYSGQSY